MDERRYTELKKMINHLLNSCNDLRPPAPASDSDAEREKLAQRLAQLAKAVSRQQWNEFDMRVPAEPQRDADLVLSRAAQLLRQPVPAPASDEELEELEEREEREEREELADELDEDGRYLAEVAFARECNKTWRLATRVIRAAALLRQPAPVAVPVAVAERPWERKGWRDTEGRCWWFNRAGIPEWQLTDGGPYGDFSLPANALPVPDHQPPQGGEVR